MIIKIILYSNIDATFCFFKMSQNQAHHQQLQQQQLHTQLQNSQTQTSQQQQQQQHHQQLRRTPSPLGAGASPATRRKRLRKSSNNGM